MSYRPTAVRAALLATASAAALLTALPATAAAAPAVPVPAAPSAVLAPGEQISLAAFDLAPAPDPAAVAARAGAVRIAMSKIGKPYRYGATGPNAFDCSGLVQWTYKQLGVKLPRTSRAMSGVGTPVSRANLQPGDLVFFYKPVSHVAIYVGNGKIVHASTSGSPVKVSELKGRKFHSARRV
ncbi:MAG: C40 family peptidase [Pseudonocardia sp.]